MYFRVHSGVNERIIKAPFVFLNSMVIATYYENLFVLSDLHP